MTRNANQNPMKKLLLSVLTVLLIVGATSCKKINGKGDLVNESRTVTNYSEISLSLPGQVNFKQDSVYRLTVNAQENLMPYIQTYTNGGTLVIKVKNNYVLGIHDPITINITAPGVSSLHVNGSGDIYVAEAWTPATASLNISGSGNINVDTLSCENLNARISGSGNINISKGIDSGATLNISGSGTIHSEGVASATVTSTISGSGNIYCWAVAQLLATISGSGSIYYKGTPQVETHISGSGTVQHL